MTLIIALLLNIWWLTDLNSIKTFAAEYTIMHAADFQGNFEEITLANGTKVGGVGRVAHVLKKCGSSCIFVYHGNLLSSTSGTDNKSVDHSINILKQLNPHIVTFGKNEYNSDPDVIERLEKEFKIPRSNIGSNCPPPTDVSGISFLTYAEGVSGMRAVPSRATVFKLEQYSTCEAHENIFLIVAGCFSYKKAKAFAEIVNGVDIILSSCSKDLLWNAKVIPENMTTRGMYPEIFNGRLMLAHIYGGTKFVGKLTLDIVEKELKSYESEMLYMYEDVPQDPDMLKILNANETTTTTSTKPPLKIPRAKERRARITSGARITPTSIKMFFEIILVPNIYLLNY